MIGLERGCCIGVRRMLRVGCGGVNGRVERLWLRGLGSGSRLRRVVGAVSCTGIVIHGCGGPSRVCLRWRGYGGIAQRRVYRLLAVVNRGVAFSWPRMIRDLLPIISWGLPRVINLLGRLCAVFRWGGSCWLWLRPWRHSLSSILLWLCAIDGWVAPRRSF